MYTTVSHRALEYAVQHCFLLSAYFLTLEAGQSDDVPRMQGNHGEISRPSWSTAFTAQ